MADLPGIGTWDEAALPITESIVPCPYCGRTFADNTCLPDTMRIGCPDDGGQHPSSQRLEACSALDPIRGVRHTRLTVLDTRFDSLDQDGVVTFILDAIALRHGGWVVTPNVDILRLMATDPAYKSLVDNATLVLVDGAPVQWAARISGHSSIHRTPGSTLMLPLAAAAAQRGVPLLLLGGREGAGECAAAALQALYPDLDVRWHCPPLGFEDDEEHWAAVERVVAQCDEGIVMCGLGAPKQELVASRLLATNPRTWFLGVGATIDFTAGMVSRAPAWMQQAGVEWLYRLLVEPRRLFRRYVVDDLPFAARLLSWAIRERAGRTQAALMSEGASEMERAALLQARTKTEQAA